MFNPPQPPLFEEVAIWSERAWVRIPLSSELLLAATKTLFTGAFRPLDFSDDFTVSQSSLRRGGMSTL